MHLKVFAASFSRLDVVTTALAETTLTSHFGVTDAVPSVLLEGLQMAVIVIL